MICIATYNIAAAVIGRRGLGLSSMRWGASWLCQSYARIKLGCGDKGLIGVLKSDSEPQITNSEPQQKILNPKP